MGDGKDWMSELVIGTKEFVCVAFASPLEVRFAVTFSSPVAMSKGEDTRSVEVLKGE
jgi:hypothetical protein